MPDRAHEARSNKHTRPAPGRARRRHARLPVGLGLALVLAALLAPSTAQAAGDANQSSCPFETESSPGFRSYLPDCRAYELVTPPYGGGSPAFEVEDISPDGEHVLIDSGGGFAGNESLEVQIFRPTSSYEMSRTATGWAAESLSPPASLFPRRELVFPSIDLSRVLFKVAPPDGGQELHYRYGYAGWNLAVREPGATGEPRFTLLGPMIAPGHECEPCTGEPFGAAVVGASSDLSRVFLVVSAKQKQLWPGDQTTQGGQSLYEYSDAEGHEPTLVGVQNAGRPPWRPGAQHANEGADLLSQCGTVFDAASASGRSVFFTALAATKGPRNDACNEAGEGSGPPANALYARVDGSQTIKVSGSSSAQFSGASEDGSNVFFTEHENLYDFSLAAPEGDRLTLLAGHVAHVLAVAPDGSHVYFTSPAQLTDEANANGETAQDVPGEKLYTSNVNEPGTVAFVAGEPTRTYSRLEKNYSVQTSPDGRFIVFAAMRDLAGTDDRSTVPQLFEYDAQTGTVSRISAGEQSAGGYLCPPTGVIESGFNCDGNTEQEFDEPFLAKLDYSEVNQLEGGLLGEVTPPGNQIRTLSVAEDGTVVFRSPLALTAQAVPGRRYLFENNPVRSENVYEFREGQLYLISPADEAAPQSEDGYSRLAGIDESAKDVFLFTTDQLVPGDTNTEGDIYDAREDGGYPAPASPETCSGETCEGPVPSAPTPPTSTGSETSIPGEDLPEPRQPAAPPPAKPPRLTTAERLSNALKSCRRGPRRGRARCEAQARRRYRPGHDDARRSGRRPGR